MGNNSLEIILREYNSTIDPSVNMTLLGDWRTKVLDETSTPPSIKNTMDNMTGIIGTLAILMVQLTHHTVLLKKILMMLLMV